MGPLELTMNAFVALTGLVFSLALMLRRDRQRIHLWAALLAGLLAVASVFRGLNAEYHQFPLLWAGYFFFAIFPLAGLLFFEELSGESLPLVAKILSLILTFGLVLSLTFVPSICLVPAWLLVLALWHLVGIITATALCVQALRRPSTNPLLRSVLSSILVALSISFLITAVDWMARFGYPTPRFGPLGMLTVIYILHRMFNSEGHFRLREELARGSSTLLGLLFLVGMISILQIPPTIEGAFEMAALAFVCQIPTLFLNHFWFRIKRIGTEPILQRLSALALDDLNGYVAALNKMSEVTRACLIDVETQTQLNCELTPAEISSLNQNPYLALWQANKLLAQDTLKHEDRVRLEKLKHLMLVHDVKALTYLGPAKGFVGMRFTAFMDEAHYRSLGLLLGSMGRLIPSPKKESA